MPASSSKPAEAQLRTDEARLPGAQPGRPVVRVSSTVDLLAAVPLVLRFQPSEPSIVVIGLVPSSSEIAVTLRYDIADPDHAPALARHAASLLCAQEVTSACAVGYGPDNVITPVANALRAELAKARIEVPELLRAQGNRYWSYVCADPACCPPEGTEFDLTDHPITRGYQHLVLSSREALAATIAPVTGEAAKIMRNATRSAERRAGRLAVKAGPGRAADRALLNAGLRAVAEALALYRAGGGFESHSEAAWVALLLKDVRVRDDAWARMEPEHRAAHRRLWTDLTTLAQGDYAVVPASLLAFVAWQDGDGALGNVALDRALAEDPRYSMALLLRDALDSGAPPSMARLPMTPEEVAAAYEYGKDADESGDAPTPGQADDESESSPEEDGGSVAADGRAPAVTGATP